MSTLQERHVIRTSSEIIIRRNKHHHQIETQPSLRGAGANVVCEVRENVVCDLLARPPMLLTAFPPFPLLFEF